jgi:hypothetical protein
MKVRRAGFEPISLNDHSGEAARGGLARRQLLLSAEDRQAGNVHEKFPYWPVINSSATRFHRDTTSMRAPDVAKRRLE